MKLKKYFSLLLIFTLIYASGFSQKRIVKKAHAAFRTGEYYTAAELYQTAYRKTKDRKLRPELCYYLGECFRELNQPRKSSNWYNISIRLGYNNPYAILYYADALKMLDRIDEAQTQYEAYKKLMPDDKRADNGLLSCKMIKEWTENPSRYIVNYERTISSNFADFSPSFGKSKSEIYFSSTREGAQGKDPSKITGESYSDIFTATKDRKGKWSTPVPIEGVVNTPESEGVPCLTNEGGTMFYTSCRKIEEKNSGCKIYMSKKTYDGWSEGILVGITDTAINVGHPAVTKDELTIYFVSDSIPGQRGFGGKDIWKIVRQSATGPWGKPINLGKNINTAGDEMFPFIRQDGILYFASDGHPGFGGLDIYKAEYDASVWNVTNMGSPINSSKHDYGITFYEDTEFGFFTSSRQRDVDNLYSFKLPELNFSVKGVVVDARTDDKIDSAVVTLRSETGHEAEITSASDGSFRFNLDSNTDYSIAGRKRGYFSSVVYVSTKGVKKSKDFDVVLKLMKIDKPQIMNIYYAYDDSIVLPESKKTLDELVDILNENGNITIELFANTDHRGAEDYNDKLSRGRANEVVRYLVSKGIDKRRLKATGNGERMPYKANRKTAREYDFLKTGDILTEEFINALSKEKQEEAHRLNRRTEFKVISEDFNDD